MITGNAGGGKAMTQWSPYRGNMYHTGDGKYMETGLVRIAKKRPKERFTTAVTVTFYKFEQVSELGECVSCF